MNHLKHVSEMFAAKLLGPRLSLACLGIFFLFWQAQPQPDGPGWRDVAIGALGLVSTLACVAFAMFRKSVTDAKNEMTQAKNELRTNIQDLKTEAKTESQKRDNQHKQNLRVLVGIVQAMKTGDCSDLNTDDLFEV